MRKSENMKIRQCNNCRSAEFIIVEKILHEAELSKTEMDLTAFRVTDHKITRIFCKKCKSEYKESDFKSINFY